MTKKIKSGWLTKKGHFVKNWKKRFIVLTTDSLTYYTDSILSRKRGEFLFTNCNLSDICISNFPDTTSKPYRFALQNNISGAYLELCAHNSKEKKQWVEALTNLLRGVSDNAKEYTSPIPTSTIPSSPKTSYTISSTDSALLSASSSEEHLNAMDINSGVEQGNSDEAQKLKRLSDAKTYFLASDSDEEDDTPLYPPQQRKNPHHGKSSEENKNQQPKDVTPPAREVDSDDESDEDREKPEGLEPQQHHKENHDEERPDIDVHEVNLPLATPNGDDTMNTDGMTKIVSSGIVESQDVDSVKDSSQRSSRCGSERSSSSGWDDDEDDFEVDAGGGNVSPNKNIVASNEEPKSSLSLSPSSSSLPKQFPPPPPPPSPSNKLSSARSSSVLEEHDVVLPDLDELLLQS